MHDRPSELMVSDGVAYHIGVHAGDLAPQLFFVGDPARALRVAERFDSVDVERRHREFVTLTGRYRGLPVSVMGTGIGTDNVEIALIEAYSLLAFDLETRRRMADPPRITLIRIGTSGGIQADIAPGTAAIASHAIGTDSTGLYLEHRCEDPQVRAMEDQATALLRAATPQGYRFRDHLRPYAARASRDVCDALAVAASARGVSHVQGITLAVPGFYGASGRYIEGLTNTVDGIKECLAKLDVGGIRPVNMEMESSLIFHLAEALGIRAGTLCPVVSNPASQDSVVDYRPHVADCIDVALEAMVSLVSRNEPPGQGNQRPTSAPNP